MTWTLVPQLPVPTAPARRTTGRTASVGVLAAAAMLVAACGAPSGTPHWEFVTPAPSAPSAGPATPDASPTPATAGGTIVDSFLALTQATDRSMHVDVQGTVTFAGVEQTLTARYDIAGPDYAGTTTIDVPNMVSMSIDVVVVGGRAFGRSGEGGWAGQSTAPPPQDPFEGLTAVDVGYAGAADVDGVPGHRLRIADPVAVFTRAMGVTSPTGMGDLTVVASTYEVVVDGAGRPSTATVSLDGTATAVGEIGVTIAYTFRDWGGAFAITRPLEAPATAPPGTVLTAYNRITQPIVLRDEAGHELPVPACDVAHASAFDTTRFDILLASGEILNGVYPSDSQSWTVRVVVVGPGSLQTQPDPYVGELPTCVDYPPTP